MLTTFADRGPAVFFSSRHTLRCTLQTEDVVYLCCTVVNCHLQKMIQYFVFSIFKKKKLLNTFCVIRLELVQHVLH